MGRKPRPWFTTPEPHSVRQQPVRMRSSAFFNHNFPHQITGFLERKSPGRLERFPGKAKKVLLEFDFRASFFKLLLGGIGVSLGQTFLHRLRSAVDQVFGFLQAQAMISRTALMTLTLLAPTSASTTVNSVCSSAAAAAPPAAAERPQQQRRQQPTRQTSLPFP